MTPTIQDMEQKAAEIAELRIREEEKSRDKKEVSKLLEKAELEMLEMLHAGGIDSYRSNAGTVSITHRTSVKIPREMEAKQKFFTYLREKGLFDQMVSVNSMTLNSFYKAELEAARAAGNVDFAIPGIDGVTIEENLSFRRA